MHRHWLLKTLALAKKSKGFCAPNPAVGAIVVKDDRQLSSGRHIKAGEPHAEYLALKQLSYPLTGATLYISLEPCSHWGKTPPCMDEIIRSGVTEVIFAHMDPNPLIKEFDTISRLNAHGIQCQQVEIPEITEFYKSYDYWTVTNKPWLTVKIAQSLNGKVALSRDAATQITGEALKQFTFEQRKSADGILTTSSTVLADNPQLTVRMAGQKPIDKPIALLDRTLSVAESFRLFDSSEDRYIFHGESYQSAYQGNTRKYVALSERQQKLDLKDVIKYLGNLGWHDIWVEAGGKLFTTLLQEKLINCLYVYLSPCWLPQDAVDAYRGIEVVSGLDNGSVEWLQYDNEMVAKFQFLNEE